MTISYGIGLNNLSTFGSNYNMFNDKAIWTFLKSGQYLAKFVYKAQLFWVTLPKMKMTLFLLKGIRPYSNFYWK
jgi:hypothetical protein